MTLKIRTILVVTIGVVLGFSISVTHAVLAGQEAQASKPDVTTELPYEYAELISRVLEKIRNEYVEEVSDEQILEKAVRGMLELDPHSAFLNREEFEQIRITTSGNYSGVGVEVDMSDSVMRVIAPIDGTPAQRAGILAGDLIVSVDGHPVTGHSMEETIGRMRGKPGSIVDMKIRRASETDPLDFHLERAMIQVASVRSRLLEDGIGYMRISQFSERTGREVVKASKKLRRQARRDNTSLKGLVIDLRDNPGGVLEASVAVADAFLDAGEIEYDNRIVRAEGRMSDAAFTMYATDGDTVDGVPLIVLVNRGSASASEIVAGAIQDHHRGLIMGTTTFGKGSVQTVSPLPSGRAIKLTTAHYFTPADRSIHGKGIEPDITLDLTRIHETQYGIDEAVEHLQNTPLEEQKVAAGSAE
ncbi:MAG: S41 family peptidase [Gammaproteobacteria bacterium]